MGNIKWPSRTMTISVDEELPADMDEPPDHAHAHAHARHPPTPSFCKSPVLPTMERPESLLTRALFSSPEPDIYLPGAYLRHSSRSRSANSHNTSQASTAELTSDEGLTSPARTSTPSPPLPCHGFNRIPSLGPENKAAPSVDLHPSTVHETRSAPQRAESTESVPRKRCITFACGGGKNVAPNSSQPPPSSKADEAPRRPCAIKFACVTKIANSTWKSLSPNLRSAPPNVLTIPVPRSPSTSKKAMRGLPTSPARHRRSSVSTMLQNHSPSSFKSRPKFLTADEEVLNSSDATQFHEFAREKMQDDEWIRRADDVPRARLTINDTLKIENEIRKLGHEAEEEANDENEDDDVDRNNTSDADEDDDLGDSHGVSDDHDSDGNESDNEAGFADSDDENDPDGNFEFWTPGKHMPTMQAQRRPGPPRKLSTSSIDSTDERSFVRSRSGMSKPVPFTLRPGTPELPDSTDFVCGTLDEDRPLEAAYASCLEARKTAKHALIPQDIDPSFPASDPEDDDVENDATVRDKIDQEEQIGTSRVEESDDGRSRHQSSPAHSPGIVNTALPPVKRCRSPPPKFRLRSPPPRKLFGHSPRRMTSPAPCRTDESPAPSINDAESTQLPLRTSTPLGLRPGLTHTKSLPRTAALWSRSHRPARPYATEHDKDADIHARGAIDIVKGLEQKRQHREKMYKPRRCQPKKKPQPGQGAERMKELGLLMAGKTSTQTSYMLSL